MQSNPPTRSPGAAPARPWYRHRWPWLLMLGPFLVVVAGSATIFIAWTRQDAMVVADYYKQGKAINQDLRRDRAASALGLVFDASWDAGTLSGSLRSGARPLAGPLRIRLAHSTQAEKDIELAPVLGRDGRFAIAMPNFGQARWQVVVEGELRDWRLAGGWLWPKQRQLHIEADRPPPGP